MFDACEAVNDLINEINEDYYESCYNAIYEELCEKVENGELTIEDAEMINEAATKKYLQTYNHANLNRIMKEYKKYNHEIKSEWKKVKDSNDISELKKFYNDLTKIEELSDEMIDEVKSIKTTNMDTLEWIAKEIIPISLFSAISATGIRYAQHKYNKEKYSKKDAAKDFAFYGAISSVYASLKLALNSLQREVLLGKESEFGSYKGKVVNYINQNKKLCGKMKQELSKKIAELKKW